eukprot:3556429-Pleurochrysis_carterae.AAC.1
MCGHMGLSGMLRFSLFAHYTHAWHGRQQCMHSCRLGCYHAIPSSHVMDVTLVETSYASAIYLFTA